ncbi:DUF2066 domain-containing protein [Colwellia sp. 12G3]|uniref:DUF2066 domain-containing protein n=1 Tax=Colwellia sp. 12G3 TaxID=2058299 RepID=UPI000C32BFEC|nr:DUF2066 domain-containing protein [Colwellia sp. 12G3]PKI18039.1 DUF2066 domain-containing protein [Colwellia sp. 12G3]
MFRFPFVIIIVVFALLSASSAALEVNDLYQANVVVDSQDRAEREQAIKKALQGVFLKVGGKKSVLAHDVLKKAQTKASSYVSQYRYQRKDEQLSLIVSFNEDKINQLFEDANLALWGSLRPQVLLWLIDEQGTSRSIVASDADSLIPISVNDFSIERGLPIIMPLMDLTDSEQVLLSDFWGYFPEQIQQASLRYFADTIVVMRVSDSSLVDESVETIGSNTVNDVSCGLLCEQQEVASPKVLDWRVFTQGSLYTQKYRGVDKVSLIEQGLSDITALIYQSYALLASAENDFIIEVNNVTSLKSDIQLFNFLTDLSAVKTVTLLSAQSDVRQFKLDLIGSKASFLASLKLNNKLTQQLDGLFEGFSQTQQFNNPENVTIDLNNSNTDQVKVIVLGETVENTVTPLITKPDVHVNKSTTETNPTLETSIDLNANSDDELTKNDQLQILTETPPLKIVPKIPVFYWEQG